MMMTDHAEMVPTTSSSTSYIDTADLLDEELWLSLTRGTHGQPPNDKAAPRPANVAQTAPLEDLDSWLTFSPQQSDMAWQHTSNALASPGLTAASTDAASVASTSSWGDGVGAGAGTNAGVAPPRGIVAPRQRSDSEGNRSRSKVRTATKPRIHRSASSTSRAALSPVRDVADHDEAGGGGVGKSSRPRSRPARRASIGPAAAAMLRIPASAPGNKQGIALQLDTASASSAGVGTGPQSVPGINAHHQHNFAPGSPPVTGGPSLWPGPGSWPGVAPPWSMPMIPPHLPQCGGYPQQAHAPQGFEGWPMPHAPMVSPGMATPSGPSHSHAHSHSHSHSQAMQGVFDGMSGLHVHPTPPQETSMAGIVAEQQQQQQPAPISPVTTRSPPHQQGARRGSKSTCHGGASRVLEDVPEDRAAADVAVDDDDDEHDLGADDDVSMNVSSPAVRPRGATSAQPRSRSSDSRSSGSAPNATAANTTTDRRARRRESHNLVERRRRDTINERIAELASLLPEAMLLDAIANSQSGGNASKVVKLPMPASAMANHGAGTSSSPAALNGEDLASAPADSETLAAAQARPNKSIILRKSVDYIRALQDFIEHQRRQNAELQHQNEAMVMMMGATQAGEGYHQGQQEPQHHYAGEQQQHHYQDDSAKRLWPEPAAGPMEAPTFSHHHGSQGLPGQTQQHTDAFSHPHADVQHHQPRPSLGEWLARHPEEQARYAGVRSTTTTSPIQQKQAPIAGASADSDSWASSSQSPHEGASSVLSSLGSASATSASPTLSTGAQGQGKGEGGQQEGGALVKAENVEGPTAGSHSDVAGQS